MRMSAIPAPVAIDAMPDADRTGRGRNADRHRRAAHLRFHGNSVHQLGHGTRKSSPPSSARWRPCRSARARLRQLDRDRTGAPSRRNRARGLDKVLFAPSGAAAIGMALKLARYATGRHKTLSLWDSFHGANLDTIGVGGEALFRRGLGPMAPGAEHLPPWISRAASSATIAVRTLRRLHRLRARRAGRCPVR